MNTTEIIRTVQLDEKTVTIHIHLTEDEVRRVLLPHIASAFASELHRHTPRFTVTTSGGTDQWPSLHLEEVNS